MAEVSPTSLRCPARGPFLPAALPLPPATGTLTGETVELIEELVLHTGEHVPAALASTPTLGGVVCKPSCHRGGGGRRSHNGLLVPLEDVPHGGRKDG